MREETEIGEKPDIEAEEVAGVFQCYGLPAEEIRSVVAALRQQPQAWVDFMMRFELGLEKHNPKREFISAATIAGAYIAGGFVPLGPYIILSADHSALTMSVVTTIIALLVLGTSKVASPGAPPKRYSLVGWLQPVSSSPVRFHERLGISLAKHYSHGLYEVTLKCVA